MSKVWWQPWQEDIYESQEEIRSERRHRNQDDSGILPIAF